MREHIYVLSITLHYFSRVFIQIIIACILLKRKLTNCTKNWAQNGIYKLILQFEKQIHEQQEQRTLFSEKKFNLCDKAPTQDMVHVYRQTMLYK